MQYADIALPVRTATRQNSFTYTIPPAILPEISIGQRVSVPFGRRQMVGTVIGLRATPPKNVHLLKPIKRLVEPFPIFTQQSLELADRLALHYGATTGEILESAGPTPAPRTAQKLAATLSSTNTEPKLHQGLRYGYYLPILERYNGYLQLIRKALAAEGSVLILFPNQEQVADFAAFITANKIQPIIQPPSTESAAGFKYWVAGLTSKTQVFIGTRKAIFLPIQDLTLVIIDQPSEYGYKEEQFPYYNSVTVAQMRATLSDIKLILGDSAPRLADYYDQQQGKMQFLAAPKITQKTTLIDTTTHRGIISDILLERMTETLARGGRVGLYYNRKGSGGFFHCLTCETAFYCPRCDTLLQVKDSQAKIILDCPICQYQSQPPYQCPVCQSYKLGSAGMGIERLSSIIQEHFPNEKVATLSSESRHIDNDSAITIMTSQLFFLPAAIRFDLLVTFQIDQLLHGSDWSTNEQAYLKLSHLAERAEHLIIQTSEPEHSVILAFCRGNHQPLYEAELGYRTEHGYPPIQPLIRLAIAGFQLEKVKAQADQLYQELYATIGQSGVLFPPSPIGSGKRRGKYRYQIIIKSQLTPNLLSKIPAQWLIDPEPEHLNA